MTTTLMDHQMVPLKLCKGVTQALHTTITRSITRSQIVSRLEPLSYNLGRVSRWEDDYESKRKCGWGEESEKIFTPQTFSFVPNNFTINEFEIWISKYKDHINT